MKNFIQTIFFMLFFLNSLLCQDKILLKQAVDNNNISAIEDIVKKSELDSDNLRQKILLPCFEGFYSCEDIKYLKYFFCYGFIPSTAQYNDKYDLLFIAANCNDLEFIKNLTNNSSLQHFASMEASFILSVRRGNVEIVKYFINNGCSPVFKDKDGNGILYNSITSKKLDMVKFALQFEQELCYSNTYTTTGLDNAILGGNSEMVKYLLKNEKLDCINNYSLKRAIGNLDFETFQEVKKRAGLELQEQLGSSGDNLLQYVISINKSSLYTLDYLDAIGIDFLHLDNKGNTALFYCKDDNTSYVNYLLEKGLDINQKNYEGQTYLETRYDNLREYLLLTSITKEIINKNMPIDNFLVFLEMIDFLLQNGAYVDEAGDGEELLKQLLIEVDRADIWEYYKTNF